MGNEMNGPESALGRSGAVLNPSSGSDSLRPNCNVCGERSVFFGEADVLRKYRVQYFRCQRCGFIQTETPYWLDEAYSSAIARQDVGIMQRNLTNCDVTTAVLNVFFPKVKSCVDFGAGHGVFVRLMRDRGFNFYWSDLHAANNYARGFESPDGATFDFLTAFEVLEHLVDPVAAMAEWIALSENIFLSTWLVPEPAPKLGGWWYYVPTSGQHVSFHTKESLRLLAQRFDRHLLSVGSFHLITKEPQSNFLYQVASRARFSGIVNRFYRRPSLVESDFQQMSR